MTTFVPRAPYTKEELEQLYPKSLELEFVQIVGYCLVLSIVTHVGKVLTARLLPASQTWYINQPIAQPCSANIVKENDHLSLLDFKMYVFVIAVTTKNTTDCILGWSRPMYVPLGPSRYSSDVV